MSHASCWKRARRTPWFRGTGFSLHRPCKINLRAQPRYHEDVTSLKSHRKRLIKLFAQIVVWLTPSSGPMEHQPQGDWVLVR
eukprot:UN17339